jgi:hypothetical protein
MADEMEDSIRERAEGVDLAVQEVTNAIRRVGGSIRNIGEHVGSATVDFRVDEPEGVSAIEAARGGRFGSSVVVNTGEAEVSTATIRLGEMGLVEGADEFAALSRLSDRVADGGLPVPVGVESRGPAGPISQTDESPVVVFRFRQMAGDIIHVEIIEPVSVTTFSQMFPLIVNGVEEHREEAREFGNSFA